ncbi:DMT family transporter [Domibacillus robiginosus]|uniref:DMT family transporter n=1 Tax=Domibacillus robiginosus TaxID=1071054 RepID=UPI000A401CB9|nr:EamA family transporter [Domibacillus robiginosus]
MKAVWFVLTGASLWGMIGLFVQGLYGTGFSPIDVVALRTLGSALVLFVFLLVFKRHLLRIRLRDGFVFAGCGIISLALFNLCFFTVIERSSNSLAVVLLYTGPVFVVLLSRLFFKEPLTGGKITALLFTVIGCSLAVGLVPSGEADMKTSTIFIGLLSGFFYALYSIFGKFVVHRYHSVTITAYAMLMAAVFIVPMSSLFQKTEQLMKLSALWNVFGLVVLSTVFAYIFYTAGLAKMESGRAAILATAEPVVAIFIGLLIFGDRLTGWQAAGILCILAAVLFTIERRPAKIPASS